VGIYPHELSLVCNTEIGEAQFVQNIWIESYDPTIEDSYRKTLEVDVGEVSTELDTVQSQRFHRADKSCWRFLIPLERSSSVSHIVCIR
jgi:hypothetical protein